MLMVVGAVLILLLKAMSVTLVAFWLRDCLKGVSNYYCILGAWLAIQMAQLFGMAALSLAGTLNSASYTAYTAVLSLGFMVVYTTHKPRAGRFGDLKLPSPPVLVGLGLVLFVLVLLIVRAVFFFDTTYDSFMYSLPRIGYFWQHQSIFAREPDIISRIYCNEWNAELNALHYGLLLRSDQGLMAAGVEVWCLALIAVIALARAIGSSNCSGLWVGLLIVSTPALFNLTGVTKGDVLGMASVVAALGGLLWIRSSDNCYLCVVYSLLWLAFGAGCKGTIIPMFVIFVGISAVWIATTTDWSACVPRRILLYLTVVCPCLFFFLLRHITNIIVFGNAIQRCDLERSVTFDWRNMPIAMLNQLRYSIGISPDQCWRPGYHFSETRDLGATGWVLASCVPLLLLLRCRTLQNVALSPIVSLAKLTHRGIAWLRYSFLSGMVVSWLYLSGMMPLRQFPDWANFQLRFFLWFIIPIVVLIFHLLSEWAICRRRGIVFLAGALLIVLANIKMAFSPSDTMNANKGLRNIPQIVRGISHFEAKLAGPHASINDLGELAAKRGQSQDILVAMYGGSPPQYQGNPPIYQFFGQNMEWRVEFAGSPAAMEMWIDSRDFDWIIQFRDGSNDVIPAEGVSPSAHQGFSYHHTGRWAHLYKRCRD